MKKIFTLFFACFVCVADLPANAGECRPVGRADALVYAGEDLTLMATNVGLRAARFPVRFIPDPAAAAVSRLAVGAATAPVGILAKGLIHNVKNRPDLKQIEGLGFFQCDKYNGVGDSYECDYGDGVAMVVESDGQYNPVLYRCKKTSYKWSLWNQLKNVRTFLKAVDGLGEWQEEDLPWCTGQQTANDFVAYNDTQMVLRGSSPKGQGDRPVIHGKLAWSVGEGSACVYVKCINGTTYNSDYKMCLLPDVVAQPSQPSKPSNNTNPTYGGKKSCRDQHKNDGRDRLACCDVEDAKTGWWQDGACHCNNKSATFKVLENGTGWCEVKSGDNQQLLPVVCTDKENMDAECNCKPKYTHKENGYCKCDDINARLVDGACSCAHISGAKLENGSCVCGKDKEVSGNQCGYTKEYLNRLKIDIDNKYSKLTSITAGFKQSEWRDAEGEFNTARLASDSIAGVVLGTVGGVVTSHLVKKAQVKQGFEDLQCYIGGQSVADWGDGFVVGR